MAYKKDQGRMARMAAYWSLAILSFYGSYSLFYALQAWFPGKLDSALGGITIPILGLDLTAALLISALVLGAALFVLYRWQNQPKVADLLIETESELKKVTWPTPSEAINSSLVVLFTVAFLMVYLAGADWALGKWATYLLVGN